MANIRFYLEFNYPNGSIVREYITEPPGYDAFAYRVKQGSFRFGRDKTIGGEEIGITLWDIVGEESTTPYITTAGKMVYFRTHALDKVIELSRASAQGFEAVIFFGVTDGNTDFINGQLDIPKSKTDELTYFSCNVIQDTKLQQIERKKNVSVNVFSTEDLYGNPVAPLQTVRMLQKAKPTVQKSRLSSPNRATVNFVSYGGDAYLMNSAIQIDESDVEDTINPNSVAELVVPVSDDNIVIDAIGRKKLLVAREDLTNVVIDLTNVTILVVDNTGIGTNKSFEISVGTDPINDRVIYPIIPNTAGSIIVNAASYQINLPFVGRGQTVWLYLQVTSQTPTVQGSPVGTTTLQMEGMDVNVTATSNAVDRVINVVRYPDFLKAGILRLSGLNFSCPDLEVGGKFENLYVWNGYMQRNIPNKPFNFVFEDQFGQDMRWLGNSDYEITQNGVDHGDYDFFYPNVDLGSFFEAPDSDFERTVNERFQIQTYDVKFANYDKDDRSKNTVDSFQTEAQRTFPNGAVENNISLTIKNVWDAFEQEKNAIQGLRQTTALESDDKVSIVDVVALSNSAQGTIRGFLTVAVINGQVLIYNKAIGGDSNQAGASASFFWTQTGISVTDQISFTAGGGMVMTATVDSIEDNLIRLNPINFVPATSGISYIIMTYYYTNVGIVNRTNQGFNSILNLQSGDNCSNLKYTIARNDEYWYNYFATIVSASAPTDLIRTTKFVNNDQLTTQFMGGRVLREGEDIPVSRLDQKILTIDVYNTRVSCSFGAATALFNTVLRGFIRLYNKRGEIKKVHLADCAMLWRDEILEINKGEVRFDPDQFTINSVSGGGITFNGTPYTGFDFWEINNGYFRAFDSNRVLLNNPVYYGDILIDGVPYPIENDFRNALLAILPINP